jgi:hypothetical protein
VLCWGDGLLSRDGVEITVIDSYVSSFAGPSLHITVGTILSWLSERQHYIAHGKNSIAAQRTPASTEVRCAMMGGLGVGCGFWLLFLSSGTFDSYLHTSLLTTLRRSEGQRLHGRLYGLPLQDIHPRVREPLHRDRRYARCGSD